MGHALGKLAGLQNRQCGVRFPSGLPNFLASIMSDEEHLIPVPNIHLDFIRDAAMTVIRFKRSILTKELGREPTRIELAEATETERTMLHTIKALKRQEVRKNIIPASLLVQIFMAKLRT